MAPRADRIRQHHHHRLYHTERSARLRKRAAGLQEEIDLLKEGLNIRHVLLRSVRDQIAAEDDRIKRLEEARHQEEAAAAALTRAEAGLTPAAASHAADGLHAYGF